MGDSVSQVRGHSANGPDRRKREIAAALGILVVCVILGLAAAVPSDAEMIDQALFRITVEHMRNGEGYYSAYDSAQDIVYGPQRAAITETIRAFRMPTTFLLWQLLPSEEAIWWLFVTVAGLTGIVATRLVARPELGIFVSVYLLGVGVVLEEGQSTAQFMTTELWAVGPILGALVMARRERWWMAAGLAVLAVLVRELAAPLLAAGVLLAVLGRAPRPPWFTGAAVALGAYVLHAMSAAKFIEPTTSQAPIVDETQLPFTILEMMGFALPAGIVIGPILWLLAVRSTWRSRRLLDMSVLGLPLVGLIIDRPYWGILVAPIAAIWGIDHLLDVVRRRPSASSAAV
ncbi:MAG TPA: hypothetical protein VM848_00735 [Acidimicrobiia bacterium]|nr:hypothetical protein [Acidimicrobiia bacterium]